MNVSDIEQRIQNAKDLDFGTLFNQSLELFKQVWVQGLITVLLTMVMAIPVVMVFYIPLIFMGIIDAFSASYYGGYGYYNEPEIGFATGMMMFVLYIFMIIALSAISIALRAAFYRICKLKDLGEMGKEDYFYFLKKPYLSKTIILGLAYIGISLLATLLCFIPIIYALVPLSYIFVVYAFNPDKSVSEIINISFKLGNKKWLLTFGLLIVCGFLAGIVGFLLCFIGIYVTQSFAYLQTYLIYKEVVGFDEESTLPQIEEQASI